MQLALEMGRNNKHVKRWKLGGFWKQHIILAWVRLPIDKYSCRSVQVLTADVSRVRAWTCLQGVPTVPQECYLCRSCLGVQLPSHHLPAAHPRTPRAIRPALHLATPQASRPAIHPAAVHRHLGPHWAPEGTAAAHSITRR